MRRSGAPGRAPDTTVIVNDAASRVRGAGPTDGLWVTAAQARHISGWELTPEGACQGARCVPLPAGAVRNGILDLAVLARHLGQPVVHDRRHDVWVIGEAADELQDRMLSLEAPDFTLPDLAGRLHSLSHYRGKKILLVTWASW